MEEIGLFPGRTKFEGEGMKPKIFDALGTEKSAISSFMMIPVSGTMSWDPNRRLTVVVKAIAKPSASEARIPDVPCLNLFALAY